MLISLDLNGRVASFKPVVEHFACFVEEGIAGAAIRHN